MNTLMKSAVVAMASCLVAACGGGGGSGGTTTALSYTGLTTPAPITTSNGQTLATQSYNGSKFGTAIASLTGDTSGHSGGSRLLSVYKVLDATVGGIDPTVNGGVGPAATLVTAFGSVQGNCLTNPGSYSYGITIDDTNGNYDGDITYSSYCDFGQTFNGASSFSGNYDIAAKHFNSINLQLKDINVSSTLGANTLSGTLNIDSKSNPKQITMNLLNREDASGDVYKVENFVLSDAVASDQSYDDVTLQGRFYAPNDGYVDLTTPQPIHALTTDDWPSSGILKLTGKNNATATLTVLSNASYQVDIDIDGDGVIDDTVTGNWASP